MGLVLDRKVGEKFYIGSDIQVTVLKVSGSSRVKLLFEAPLSVKIGRTAPDLITSDEEDPELNT